MSEDDEKKSEEDEDILSVVESLLDSPEKETSDIKHKTELPMKKNVVPVIVRPPKKLEPKEITPIKPKIEPTPIVPVKPKIEADSSKEILKKSLSETIKEIKTADATAESVKEETESPLSLDELADTVLGELDSELDVPETPLSKSDSFKLDLDFSKISTKSTTDEPKKTIPLSYKVSFGTHKKIETLQKDVYVWCPKCGYKFETLDNEDIICPKCHFMFNR